MRGPSTQERKYTLIVVLSLLAAVVCFGLLRSSGQVEQTGVSLGGAFAGFVVTSVILLRAWRDERPEAIVDTDPAEQRGFAYDEVIKVLDFRSDGGPDDGVRLSDYYRVRKRGPESTIVFHYATTGSVDDATSVTHPESCAWREVSVTHTGGDGQILKHEYELEVDLGELAGGQVTPVISQLVYRGAFQGRGGEWLETHVDHPTGRLGMIVITSDSKRIRSADAQMQLGRAHWSTLAAEPAVLQRGTIIYWSIDRPVRGARYQVKWTWAGEG